MLRFFVRVCMRARVALRTQHATRTRSILLSCVASLTAPHFFTIWGGGGGEILNIKCVLVFIRLLSKTFLILRKIQRDIVINVKTSSCKVPVISVRY
jgi:hypothetical protein